MALFDFKELGRKVISPTLSWRLEFKNTSFSVKFWFFWLLRVVQPVRCIPHAISYFFDCAVETFFSLVNWHFQVKPSSPKNMLNIQDELPSKFARIPLAKMSPFHGDFFFFTGSFNLKRLHLIICPLAPPSRNILLPIFQPLLPPPSFSAWPSCAPLPRKKKSVLLFLDRSLY